MRIKRYVDHHIACEKCGRCDQKFSVYQEYFHIFLIPLFPFTHSKTIASVCIHCNDKFNEKKKDYYLSKTKTPWYMYSGVILIVGIILTIIMAVSTSLKQEAEYIANPQIGDVYRMRENENNVTIYYFTKITNIETDSIDLLLNSFQYNHFTSIMDTADFFVSDEVYRFANSAIQELYDKGTINAVERDYDTSSQFVIEKER
ncbi:MAG: hypothetical protein LBR55_04790 [Bacteroidales bacterium]|jgi:hypothetical protein|nr:hypothetical protein [Bacteroidales bacterium]